MASSWSDLRNTFTERKKLVAIPFLKNLGVESAFIHSQTSYDGLLVKYILADLTRNETGYLIEGIKSIYECLNIVQANSEITLEKARELVFDKHKDLLNRVDVDQEDREKWIEHHAHRIVDEYNENFKVTVSFLNEELAEFKIRLGRVNIDVEFMDGNVQFKRFGEIITDMEAPTKILLENPYPKIFSNLGAFRLFDRWHVMYKDTQFPSADYGFLYWKMSEDGLIVCKQKVFRDLISDEKYDIPCEKSFKTIDSYKTSLKENTYSFLKTIR